MANTQTLPFPPPRALGSMFGRSAFDTPLSDPPIRSNFPPLLTQLSTCSLIPDLLASRRTLATLLTLFKLLTSALADNLLTGTIIGTSGSFNNAGNTKEKAMDGNTATFFDAPTANNDWVGLDMTGQLPKMVTSVRYFPRASFAGRMLNGIFQGANVADFSVAVNL